MSITDSFSVDPISDYAPEEDPQPCAKCKRLSRPVTRKTVLLMLKSDRLEQVGQRNYRFCGDSECPVVYFSEDCDMTFAKEDLRVRVGLKEQVDPIPLCYCFGFDEKDVRKDLAQKGWSHIPQRIAGLIKQGMCACDTRNPSGVCCLGEINEAINKRLRLVT
jgi:hypothetical protein